MASASTTNQLANIATYQWSVNLLQASAFNNGSMSMNDGRDIVLLVENAALAYGLDQNLDGVTGVGLNVYRLVGQMLQPANEVLSSGSGGIVPSPTPGGGVLTPYIINMQLQSSQISGTTINALNGTDWIGLEDFAICYIDQNQMSLGAQFQYNIINGVFDFGLYPYYPQAGQWFTCQAYKASS